MRFPLYAYFLSLFGAFACAMLSLPLWRRICVRSGLVDDPGHRKIHSEPIALAGGFAVLTGIAVPLMIGAMVVHWKILPFKYSADLLDYGLNKRSLELIAILAGAILIVLLGWLDDRFELQPLFKFGGQLAVAALVAFANVRITLFVPSVVFSYAITMLWIVTVINAFNFMDNMNGLCTGLGAISAAFLALICGLEGQYLVTILACLTSGALIGFLPWNFPKASAFLGDMGSHLIGYLLAVMAILPHFYSARNPHRLAVIIPLLILAVPLGDLAYVVILRWRIGQPFYHGDNNHLSHRLVKRGWPKSRAVMVIWTINAAFGAAGLLLMLGWS